MRRRINPVGRYKAQRRLHFLGLSQGIDPASGLPMIELDAGSYAPAHPGLPNPVYAGGIATALVALQNAAGNLFVPGGGTPGVLFNAATGNVSPAQKQNLIAQQTAAMIAAGADPATAAAQANQDVTAVLTSYSGPGAFGVPWAGADPSQAWTTQLTTWLQSADATFNVPMWAWLAGGGFLVFLLARR
jgi:hypothetical protein